MSGSMYKSSIAAIQNGVARADGKLEVSESEIRFVPFNQTLGLGPYCIERQQIRCVERTVGKGGGLLPVTKDAIKITLQNNKVYEFILASPEEWITILSH